MPYRVALYSPDRHIRYDGRTPDGTGVGGGITARVSLLAALAALGHEVTAHVHCAEAGTHDGVRYVPLGGTSSIDADVLVAITTGGELSFAPLRDLDVTASLRIVWIQGAVEPDDIDAVRPDGVYVASNFLRDVAVGSWNVPADRVFVCYNGLKQARFERAAAGAARRDPFALAYIGPPEKGLEASLNVLRLLQAADPRYRLDVFGGSALWGRDETARVPVAGVAFKGLVGQRDLIPQLFGYEYCLALQAIEEGFGIAVQEAKRAGAIVIASDVGAFSELVRDGQDGLLVDEPHASPAAQRHAADLVLGLACDPDRRARLRANALRTPWSWSLAARTWTAHWDHVLDRAAAPRVDRPNRHAVIELPDGWHDLQTGAHCPTVYPFSPMLEEFGETDRVLIAGYYGHGNLGDEAILHAMLEQLRRRLPNLSVTVPSGDPGGTRRLHRVEAVDERDLPALMDAASASDLILVGGGGLFHDHRGLDEATTLTRWHWGLTYLDAFPAMAALFGKPLAIHAVGVGPLTSAESRRHTAIAFERADAASVRDAASRDLLRAIGAPAEHVEVSADPAFLVTSAPADRASRPWLAPGRERVTDLVAVVLRGWEVAGGTAWADDVARALDRFLASHPVSLLFVPFQTRQTDTLTDDVAAAERVRSVMQHRDRTVVCPAPQGTAETQGVLAGCRMVLAMRLHAVILAAGAGVPVAAVAYDPKVAVAMDQLGLSEYTVDVETISADALFERLDGVYRSGKAIAETLARTVPPLRAAAEADADRAVTLLRTRPYVPRPDPPALATLLRDTLGRQVGRAETSEQRADALALRLETQARLLARSTDALAAMNAVTLHLAAALAAGEPLDLTALEARLPGPATTAARPDPGAAAPASPEPASTDSTWLADLLNRKNREIWTLVRELASRPPAPTPVTATDGIGAVAAGAGDEVRRLRAELGTIHVSRAWRAIMAYRRARRALSELARHPVRTLRRLRPRLLRAIVPAPARARVRQAVGRRLQSPYAYVFDMYWRARAATYGAHLDGVRTPGAPGLVSVVLPAYNGAALMAGAVESVLAQTYRDLELIIVDDGSTDATPAMADEYASRDARVRVIHQTNQQLPRALSNGFREARGEFLTWTSCDNRLKPDFLERMVDCLRRHPCWDMTYANLDLIGEDGAPLRDSREYESYQRPHRSEHIALPTVTGELNVWANNYVGAAFLYRSRVAALIGDYSRFRFVSEDYDYWMRVNDTMVLRHADFEEPVYDYRFHGDSLTARWAELRMLENRERLMVFDDFRRDFLLLPIVWIIDGAGPIADALRHEVQAAGHLVYDGGYPLDRLPRLWVPVARVTVSDAPGSASPVRARLPDSAAHVLVSATGALPDAVDPGWDLCAVVDRDVPLPRLPRPRQGWIGAPDVRRLFAAIDIRVKSDHLARIEAEAEAPPEADLAVTVVVCTHRLGPRVLQAIRSAADQTLPRDRYEILVVNNNPANTALDDEVGRLARERFAGDPGRLRVVTCPIRGLSAARNAGIAEARGDAICFLDDDAIAQPDWLERLAGAWAAHPDAGVVGGHIRLRIPEPRPLALRPGWEKYWSHYETGFTEYTAVRYWWEFPWGANWSARRTALLQAGGFRSRYGRTGDDFWGGEELVAASLVQRLGYAIAVEPRAVVEHDVDPSRFTFGHVLRTLVAGHQVGYLAQRDLYVPMESSLGATMRQLLTRHRDPSLPAGTGRWRDIAYRKAAQLRLLAAQLRDRRRRLRRPVVGRDPCRKA